MNVRKNISAQQLSIKSIVLEAIKDFNAAEQYIIENDLSERCICAKFAFYLTAAIQKSDFKDYCVDVEYNRGFDGKERSVKRMNDAPITVDLIVHKRGYNSNYGFDNLICIEMKKLQIGEVAQMMKLVFVIWLDMILATVTKPVLWF